MIVDLRIDDVKANEWRVVDAAQECGRLATHQPPSNVKVEEEARRHNRRRFIAAHAVRAKIAAVECARRERGKRAADRLGARGAAKTLSVEASLNRYRFIRAYLKFQLSLVSSSNFACLLL